jgi:hypothetical protein
MRTQHLLLLTGIALSGAALAAEPKSGTTPGKPGSEAVPGTGTATTAASSQENPPVRPVRKNRVRQTFPPASKN